MDESGHLVNRSRWLIAFTGNCITIPVTALKFPVTGFYDRIPRIVKQECEKFRSKSASKSSTATGVAIIRVERGFVLGGECKRISDVGVVGLGVWGWAGGVR